MDSRPLEGDNFEQRTRLRDIDCLSRRLLGPGRHSVPARATDTRGTWLERLHRHSAFAHGELESALVHALPRPIGARVHLRGDSDSTLRLPPPNTRPQCLDASLARIGKRFFTDPRSPHPDFHSLHAVSLIASRTASRQRARARSASRWPRSGRNSATVRRDPSAGGPRPSAAASRCVRTGPAGPPLRRGGLDVRAPPGPRSPAP